VREAAPVFRFQAGKLATPQAANIFNRGQRRGTVETSPALHLRAAQPAPAPQPPTEAVRAAQEPAPAPVQSAQPHASEPAAPRPFPMPQRPGGAPAPRGSNLFERVKELAFARQGPAGGEERQPAEPRQSFRREQSEPLPPTPQGEPQMSFAVHQDELGDIPAFLRRGERVNA
jgi:hypothetical protein